MLSHIVKPYKRVADNNFDWASKLALVLWIFITIMLSMEYYQTELDGSQAGDHILVLFTFVAVVLLFLYMAFGCDSDQGYVDTADSVEVMGVPTLTPKP